MRRDHEFRAARPLAAQVQHGLDGLHLDARPRELEPARPDARLQPGFEGVDTSVAAAVSSRNQAVLEKSHRSRGPADRLPLEITVSREVVGVKIAADGVPGALAPKGVK